jgi:5-(carboxyamino)imidazole ribonucleotide synthase
MTADAPIVPPGGTVGILGGGQLGRMLAVAAAELGLSVHVYSPEADSPAFAVARAHTRAGWDDKTALAAFAAAVDVVTYEFENIPVATTEFLAALRPVFPSPAALAIAQDRLSEKRLFERLGIRVAPFAEVDSEADLKSAIDRVGRPAVLKTRRLGYDGKGQATIRANDDPAAAWRAINGAPAILEQLLSFEHEISVAVARGRDGRTAVYDVSENQHVEHILSTATVPATISRPLANEARDVAKKIADALDYVGLLAVELFVVRNEAGPGIIANEIAPRVHNSFHWTRDACLVSQFEQHIRAVCGWPLGDPARHSDAEMTNLIGASVEDWRELAAEPGARVHLYGKSEMRPGRKMGHVTRIRPRAIS